jgi:hypothetical protein
MKPPKLLQPCYAILCLFSPLNLVGILEFLENHALQSIFLWNHQNCCSCIAPYYISSALWIKLGSWHFWKSPTGNLFSYETTKIATAMLCLITPLQPLNLVGILEFLENHALQSIFLWNHQNCCGHITPLQPLSKVGILEFLEITHWKSIFLWIGQNYCGHIMPYYASSAFELS